MPSWPRMKERRPDFPKKTRNKSRSILVKTKFSYYGANFEEFCLAYLPYIAQLTRKEHICTITLEQIGDGMGVGGWRL